MSSGGMKGCPFCGAPEEDIWLGFGPEDYEGQVVYAKCQGCQAAGPVVFGESMDMDDLRALAFEAWDKRVTDEHET